MEKAELKALMEGVYKAGVAVGLETAALYHDATVERCREFLRTTKTHLGGALYSAMLQASEGHASGIRKLIDKDAMAFLQEAGFTPPSINPEGKS